MSDSTVHTAFITGCATGFGHRLAAQMLELGHRVVATDRTLEDWPDALGAPREELLCLAMDVRSDSQVSAAVKTALEWGEVDVLVNNAGYGLFGTQEEVDVNRVRELFDTNVLGPMRVTQALLPSLRISGGTIVQLSSVAGRVVFPESGFYAASKYALEAMTEAVFQETCTFGIRVRLIEPGAFDTQFQATATQMSPARDPDSPYAAVRDTWDARKTGVLEPPQRPERVVNAILDSLADPSPFIRVPVGKDSVRILRLRDELGPDPWSRLAADRAGLQAEHDHHEVPSPTELLAICAAGRPVPEPAWAAWRHGHLEHWTLTEEGRSALSLIARALAGEIP